MVDNSITKVEGSKTGIYVYYNASFLPGHSVIFSLPTLLKLEVNEETGTAYEFNFTNEYLERFAKARSKNYLFSKLEGQIFGGITVCTVHTHGL